MPKFKNGDDVVIIGNTLQHGHLEETGMVQDTDDYGNCMVTLDDDDEDYWVKETDLKLVDESKFVPWKRT